MKMNVLNEKVATEAILFPIRDGWGDVEVYLGSDGKLHPNGVYKYSRLVRAGEIAEIKALVPEMVKEIGNWMKEEKNVHTMAEAKDKFYYSCSKVAKRAVNDIEITAQFCLFGYSGWPCSAGIAIKGRNANGDLVYVLNVTVEEEDLF